MIHFTFSEKDNRYLFLKFDNDNDYEVLYLSVFGQKSNDEIAKLLEINPETARKKVYRARQRLAQKITEKRGVAV